MKNKKVLFIGIVAAVFVLAGIGYVYRGAVRDAVFELSKPAVPAPVSSETAKGLGNVTPSAPTKPVDGQTSGESAPQIPAEINLAVPFSPQAPFGVWDAFHDDACEEASALMVGHFWKNQPITTPDDADWELLAIKKLEDKIFGYDKDTTVEETARFMQEFYGFKNIAVRYNITIDDIISEVGRGRPVILPLYGRGPLNPYFRGNGPDYHMLVVKGYTMDGKFIVNDPGTKRGKDYIYDENYLYNAIHDWNGGDVQNGQKAMIVAQPN